MFSGRISGPFCNFLPLTEHSYTSFWTHRIFISIESDYIRGSRSLEETEAPGAVFCGGGKIGSSPLDIWISGIGVLNV